MTTAGAACVSHFSARCGLTDSAPNSPVAEILRAVLRLVSHAEVPLRPENNLSVLGVSATQLDNKLGTKSFSLVWLTDRRVGLWGRSATSLEHRPVGYAAVPYPVGGEGSLLHINMERTARSAFRLCRSTQPLFSRKTLPSRSFVRRERSSVGRNGECIVATARRTHVQVAHAALRTRSRDSARALDRQSARWKGTT
jgi:hypothetical protein